MRWKRKQTKREFKNYHNADRSTNPTTERTPHIIDALHLLQPPNSFSFPNYHHKHSSSSFLLLEYYRYFDDRLVDTILRCPYLLFDEYSLHLQLQQCHISPEGGTLMHIRRVKECSSDYDRLSSRATRAL